MPNVIMVFQVKSRPSAILLDMEGVIATKESTPFSESRKRFYRTNLENFMTDPALWGEREGGRKRDKSETVHGVAVGILNVLFRIARSRQQKRGRQEGEPDLEGVSHRSEKKSSLMEYFRWNFDHNPNDNDLIACYFTIWGYHQGLLKTFIYPDVPRNLIKWRNMNIPIYQNSPIPFSKMLENTDKGNLSHYFKGYFKFDGIVSNEGPSKFNIKDLTSVLFITHSANSGNLAAELGYRVVLIVRQDFDPNFDIRIKEQQDNLYFDSTVATIGTTPIPEESVSQLTIQSSVVDLYDTTLPQEEVQERTQKDKDINNIFRQESMISYRETRRFAIVYSLDEIKIP